MKLRTSVATLLLQPGSEPETVVRHCYCNPAPKPLFPQSSYYPISAYYRGTISATGVVDRLLGRMSAYLRGEFIEDINDHATSEYVRLFEQLVINSRVPLLDKTLSVVVDALENVAEKVCARSAG